MVHSCVISYCSIFWSDISGKSSEYLMGSKMTETHTTTVTYLIGYKLRQLALPLLSWILQGSVNGDCCQRIVDQVAAGLAHEEERVGYLSNQTTLMMQILEEEGEGGE